MNASASAARTGALHFLKQHLREYGMLLSLVAIMAFYALHLAIWAWALTPRELGAIFYLGLGVAAAQAGWHGTLIRLRQREGCFRAFRLNHWLGCSVFAGIALSYALK